MKKSIKLKKLKMWPLEKNKKESKNMSYLFQMEKKFKIKVI